MIIFSWKKECSTVLYIFKSNIQSEWVDKNSILIILEMPTIDFEF